MDPVVCGVVDQYPDFPFACLWMHLDGSVAEVRAMPRVDGPRESVSSEGGSRSKRGGDSMEQGGKGQEGDEDEDENQQVVDVDCLNSRLLGIIARGLSSHVYPFLDGLPCSRGE
jgi:hypothetical protein